mmetsp:Transcript_7598/g.15630  ORF Transcript_7598/g.15630 Transcript_7598/m.15630 type:complete len:236 (+) Transcript_7598:119-826(+)
MLQHRHCCQNTSIQNIATRVQHRQRHGEFPNPFPGLQDKCFRIECTSDQNNPFDAAQDAVRQEPLVLIGMIGPSHRGRSRGRTGGNSRREFERSSRHGRNVHGEIHDTLVRAIGRGGHQFGGTQGRDPGSGSPLHRALGSVVPAPQLHSHVPYIVASAAIAPKNFPTAPAGRIFVSIAVLVAIVVTGIGVLESTRPEKVSFVYGKRPYAGIIAYRDIRGTHGVSSTIFNDICSKG